MAAARKEADDRTALAEQKLASVGQLEEENTKMKSAERSQQGVLALEEGEPQPVREDGRHRSQEGRSGELSKEPCQEVVHQA